MFRSYSRIISELDIREGKQNTTAELLRILLDEMAIIQVPEH